MFFEEKKVKVKKAYLGGFSCKNKNKYIHIWIEIGKFAL